MAEKDLTQLLREIENQNKQLERLIEENNRLISSPFDLTSIERLKLLSKETKKQFKELNETLKDSHEELVKLNQWSCIC